MANQYEEKRLFDIGRYATEEDFNGSLIDPIIGTNEWGKEDQYTLIE